MDRPIVCTGFFLHSEIKNDGQELCLCPGSEGETFVNGHIITSKVILHHGDRLVIGGNHYFRVSSPYDSKNPAQIGPQANYEYAHDELMQIQEDKLKAELEEAKHIAIQELEAAKQEAEHRLGLQQSAYEEKLKQLCTSLGVEKSALAEAHRSTELMEEQIQKLRAEVDFHKCRSSLIDDLGTVDVSPYRSNFLQEVEDIMNETVSGPEDVLETSLSEATKLNRISLHQMQVMVRESSQRCRDLGISWEFSQQQVIGESGLIPVVRVRDSKKGLISLWNPSQFINWLHQLRDFEPKYDSLKELMTVNELWEEDIEGRGVTCGQGNGRMTVNTNIIKQKLNDSLNLLSSSFNDSACSVGLNSNNKTVDNSIYVFQRDELNCYVEEINDATTKVRNICDDKSEAVSQALESMFNSIQCLRTALNLNISNDTTSEVYNNVVAQRL